MDVGSAARRWQEALEGWAIPADILAAAPRPPFGFAVATFERAADMALATETPTGRTARDGLPPGGSVLDVGCGAGAASLPLANRAGRLLGVDEGTDMLEAFAARSRAAGVEVATFAGRWPDVAGDVPPADVVVCRNVAYNVPDLTPFAAALTDHARQRVVVELTERHPLSWTGPYWRELHGLARPDGPTLDDALAVLAEAGLDPAVERWEVEWLLAGETQEAVVDFVCRRLCLAADRAGEVREQLRRHPPPASQPTATVWWRGTA